MYAIKVLVEINKLYLVSTNGECIDDGSGELKNSRSSFKAVFFFLVHLNGGSPVGR